MRVVQYIDTLGAGGKERQVVELLKGLTECSGIECELIAMSDAIHFTALNGLDIKIHTLLRKSKKDPEIFFRLYKILKKIRPDVLHTWGSMCSIYAVPAAKLLGINLVNGFLRDAPPRLSFKNKDWLRARLTFPFSHAIVSNSQAGLVAYNAPPHKSFYVHNGFDLNRITNIPGPEEIRQKYEITTEKVVGMVAGFYPRKDYDLFLKVAQEIVSQRDDVTFVAVGHGGNLEKMKKNLPVKFEQRIKFLGNQTQVEAIVNLFTVGVLASNADVHGEGISNSIMEYMAMGKPVVATDCGGNREIILDGETGFLVANGSMHDLSTRVTQLLDDEELAVRFGKAGGLRLSEEFNLQKMTQKYLNLYQGVISG